MGKGGDGIKNTNVLTKNDAKNVLPSRQITWQEIEEYHHRHRHGRKNEVNNDDDDDDDDDDENSEYDNRCWVVFENDVYDIGKFDHHPGGAVIFSCAGLDITDIFRAFHKITAGAVKGTRGNAATGTKTVTSATTGSSVMEISKKNYNYYSQIMKRYRIGTLAPSPTSSSLSLKSSIVPVPTKKNQTDTINDDKAINTKELLRAYRELHADLIQMGLYQIPTTYYISKFCTTLLLGFIAIYCIVGTNSNAIIIHLIGATLLGLFFQQSGWITHDILHHQVFENRIYADYASLFWCNVVEGYSTQWWKNKHTIHHAVTNVEDTYPNLQDGDPDLDTMPVLAWSLKQIQHYFHIQEQQLRRQQQQQQQQQEMLTTMTNNNNNNNNNNHNIISAASATSATTNETTTTTKKKVKTKKDTRMTISPMVQFFIRYQSYTYFFILLLARLSWLNESFKVAFEYGGPTKNMVYELHRYGLKYRMLEKITIVLHYTWTFIIFSKFGQFSIYYTIWLFFISTITCGFFLSLVFSLGHNAMSLHHRHYNNNHNGTGSSTNDDTTSTTTAANPSTMTKTKITKKNNDNDTNTNTPSTSSPLIDFVTLQTTTCRHVNTGNDGEITKYCLDWFNGAFQNHIDHHLFPTLPRPNLCKAHVYIKSFCNEWKLSYHETTMYDGIVEVLQYLDTISHEFILEFILDGPGMM